MANEKVSALPSAASVTAADTIYAIQAGVSVKETLGQVMSLALSTNNLSYPGNPNGNLAGTSYQTCFDTTNKLLWICTTSGSASTAVWQLSLNITQLTNGQLFIGSTGTFPNPATLTAGANISIVNGPGSITISASGGGLTVNNVTGTSSGMAVNSLNIANNAALVTLTLPATAAIGDIIEVRGSGAGGWKIAQNAGQIIHVGSSASTAGVGGSVASTNRYDAINLTCVVANTEFVSSGVQGILTIV